MEKGKIAADISIVMDHDRKVDMKVSVSFFSQENTENSPEKLYQGEVQFTKPLGDISDLLEKAESMIENGLKQHGDRFGA